MRSNDEIVEYLTFILSYGYDLNFSCDSLEKRISKSDFFIAIEKNEENPIIYIDAQELLNYIYHDVRNSNYGFNKYVECLWVSDLYYRLFKETHMTFEALFIYLPLEKAYSMFDLYHEMDFSHALNRFNELVKEQSLIHLLMRKYGFKREYISKQTGLSYQMITKLSNRSRDIRKLGLLNATKLANTLLIRMDTLLYN